MGDRVALKIQRRRYSKAAVYEVSVHHLIRRETGGSGEIIALREAFLHDGHICMAFDLHGGSLDEAMEDGPLPLARVRHVTRQLLLALERLHRCRHAHTDIKPGNVLYDPLTGDARLADLGTADDKLKQATIFGTRGYMAPEVVLGATLSTAVDLWSLGCTVFEMATGRRLFDPRRAARKKYREFSRDEDAIEVPLGETAKADEAEEAAEQIPSGTVVEGKYMLERVLGNGRFGTVWAAEMLHDTPLDGSYATLSGHAKQSAGKSGHGEDDREREWRSVRGASDLLDLALNYEYFLEISRLCGTVPVRMIDGARFRAAYFEADGALRFRPVIRRCPMATRLGRPAGISRDESTLLRDFLCGLIVIDPAARTPVSEALKHPWLQAR